MTITLSPYQPANVDDLIRVGSDNDGGYVVSKRCVDRTQVLLTFGIGDDWSFERRFAYHRPHLALLSVDPSIEYGEVDASIRGLLRQILAQAVSGRLKRIQVTCRRFRMARDFQSLYRTPYRRFLRRRLSSRNDETHITLGGLFERYLHGLTLVDDLGLFIKMDIEGDEYRVLSSLAPYFRYLNGIVVEFHFLDVLWGQFVKAMKALRSAFAVCHIHGNNYGGLIPGTTVPRILEVTMINKQLLPVDYPLSDRDYPVSGVDQPNDPSRPDIELSWSV